MLSRTPSSHPGKIIFGHSCVLRDTELSSDRMIVTGCSRGVIKAWQLSSTGALKLVAYFKSANTAKLNTLSVLPIRDFVKYTEDNDDDSNGDDSVIAKKSRAPVDDSSNISDPESPSKGKFYYDLYCVCGFSDGIAESWIMSTNNEVSSTTPAAVYQENTCPILSLSRIPRDDEAFSHRSNLHESIFLRFSNQEKVICGYADGTVVIMGINRKGLLRRISYFNIPGRVNNILINYNQRTTGYIDYDDNSTIQTQSRIDLSIPLECVLINDLAAVEVLANAAGVIPKKWTNPCERVLPYLLLENIREIEERSGVSLVDDR